MDFELQGKSRSFLTHNKSIRFLASPVKACVFCAFGLASFTTLLSEGILKNLGQVWKTRPTVRLALNNSIQDQLQFGPKDVAVSRIRETPYQASNFEMPCAIMWYSGIGDRRGQNGCHHYLCSLLYNALAETVNFGQLGDNRSLREWWLRQFMHRWQFY